MRPLHKRCVNMLAPTVSHTSIPSTGSIRAAITSRLVGRLAMDAPRLKVLSGSPLLRLLKLLP